MKKEQVEIMPGLFVGKWMINSNLEIAEWLGEKYAGRTLFEPINMVIFDRKSLTPSESEKRLLKTCKGAGFPWRFGHSDGYCGRIGGELRPQLPKQKMHCFANRMWCSPGVIEHGRIFGPADFCGVYVYIAAFSTEGYSLRHPLSHPYVSMNRARDFFAVAMAGAGCKSAAKVWMDNLIDGADRFTGDHDGYARVVELS